MMTVQKTAAWILVAACTGCSALRPTRQAITIETVPTGVDVMVDGVDRGPTPVKVDLDRHTSHHIVAMSPTSTYTRDLNPRLSTAGTLDILGASLVLIPGLGLLTPGAYDLDTMKGTMSVVLHLDGHMPAMPATEATPPAMK